MTDSLSVLIVEPSPSFVTLYRTYLEDEGWDVDVVESIPEARERIAEQQYAVAIIRMNPGDTTALALGADLKRDPEGPFVIGGTPVTDRSHLGKDVVDMISAMQFSPAYMRHLVQSVRLHLLGDAAEPTYRFKLFHASDIELEPILSAIHEAMGKAGLEEPYLVEVYNIFHHHEETEAANVLATPVLIRETPPPRARFVGDFTRHKQPVRLV